MGKIDDVFINLDHHGFEEAVVKRITMVDLLNDEMSSLLDARLKDEIKNLQQENAVLKKALELACEHITDAIEMLRSASKYDWAGVLEDNADYFIEQAKESIDETHNN